MKIVGIEFIKSDRRKCFTSDDVTCARNEGFIVGAVTDNFTYMVKPVKAYITVEVKGFRIKQDMREQILRYYGLKNLRIERFNKFLAEVLNGSIKLSITQEGRLVIKQ